jgi:hypothetical protein
MVLDGVPVPVQLLYGFAMAFGISGMSLLKFAVGIPMFAIGVGTTALGALLGWAADKLDALRRERTSERGK